MYLKSEDAYTMYKEAVGSPYFVDKSYILSSLIPFIDTTSKYICITRPRRFGKSIMANMVGAFFSNACDTSDVFDSLQIAETPEYSHHLNKHNVIYIDFSEVDDECGSYDSYITNIKELFREDLHRAYPDVAFRKEKGTLAEDLKRINQKTGEKFIFVMDEWDAIFHMPFVTEDDKRKYLLFLKGLLKGKSYVSLVYMTGILPIAKYSSGSELNMFLEYSMASQVLFSDCFGFVEAEVDVLYQRYLTHVEEPLVKREELRTWYDGYHTLSGERMYNPRSVVAALGNNQLGNYWTSSGPYDEIFYYIGKNVADVRNDIALMVAGEAVPAKIQEYAATSMNINTKEEIYSAMVVYGFLNYENGKVSIPNKELMDKFADLLQKESSLGYVHRLAKESERMLAATKAGDTATMESILKYAHDTETPLLYYNNEAELSAIVNLVYLSARDTYDVQREDKAGVGYVDFIFYPLYDKSADCIILELKAGQTPEKAIQQIKDRNYSLRFNGKLGEEPRYTGRVLAVGIGYDKETKKHNCKVEVLPYVK